MKLVGRVGSDGTLVLRRPFSRLPVDKVTEERGFAACHVRRGNEEYLATLERDRVIRGSLVFNVYKGNVRAGTVATAPRAVRDPAALPALSFSWGKRSFDGRTLTAPIWESDAGRRRDLARIQKTAAGWTVRFEPGIAEGDACDAVLALTASAVWLRMKKKQGGGAL